MNAITGWLPGSPMGGVSITAPPEHDITLLHLYAVSPSRAVAHHQSIHGYGVARSFSIAFLFLIKRVALGGSW